MDQELSSVKMPRERQMYDIHVGTEWSSAGLLEITIVQTLNGDTSILALQVGEALWLRDRLTALLSKVGL